MNPTGSEQPAPGPDPGAPVGRRVVLGMLGVAGLGVLFGSRISESVASIAAKDPTGLLGFLPGGGRFRIYSVAGHVDEITPPAYRLAVDGAVARTGNLTFADLEALPRTELTKDVQCVTGWRVPDVAWSGVLLRDLLDHVGADPNAPAVAFGSADGVYTESLTMEQARRDDVMVALAMDGEPVSNDHGGPVRLYVAAMYFYKSLKWLDRIMVGDRVEPGYREQRGYDVDAWVGQSNGRRDDPIA